jgi:putative hydrolase of the HAD superfamily
VSANGAIVVCFPFEVQQSGTARPLHGVVLALDVDGVLLDPTLGGRGSWLSEVGGPLGLGPAQIQAAFFEPYWADIVIGRAPIEPALQTALESLGCPMTAGQFLDQWCAADFVPDMEVVQAAREWANRGARLVLVTNQEHRRAAFLQERLVALLPVEGMAYSAAIGFVKEDSRFFPRATDILALPLDPSAVVLVDDTLTNVEAARHYGWGAIHFEKKTEWKREVAAALERGAQGLSSPT